MQPSHKVTHSNGIVGNLKLHPHTIGLRARGPNRPLRGEIARELFTISVTPFSQFLSLLFTFHNCEYNKIMYKREHVLVTIR